MSTAEQPLGSDLLSSIEEVIEDARNGRMFILVDAEDRENEGDLVIPAQMATPDAINFMAKHGRGLICLAMTAQRASQLKLDLMARHNNASRQQTAFTVSIEARDGISTGISAHDRARTISVAIDPTKGPDDIVTPGHVFPLIAREGGVLVRAGHTEAAVDLARLAGLNPAGVICEIMNDDGSMARLPDLVTFARRHNLRIATIADLIAYRRKHDSVVKLVRETNVTSRFGGDFGLRIYRTTVEPVQEHIALVKGDIAGSGPVLVRVHAANTLRDVLGIGEQDFSETLVQKALETIAGEGRGVFVLIRDVWPEAVTESLSTGGETDASPPGSDRVLEIGIGSQILHDLGVRDMILLSNSPHRKVVGLEGYGLNIVDYRRMD
ncbi:MAG: 3,4-dihydroxy-2-butanone-4-phosphate synthase [Alphaproteobacteria bacterium]|nr:MAG: 3,4-dihydroxy-2-butanone-4-phosphate synthase [Alphaproteobacteria bacterium]